MRSANACSVLAGNQGEAVRQSPAPKSPLARIQPPLFNCLARACAPRAALAHVSLGWASVTCMHGFFKEGSNQPSRGPGACRASTLRCTGRIPTPAAMSMWYPPRQFRERACPTCCSSWWVVRRTRGVACPCCNRLPHAPGCCACIHGAPRVLCAHPQAAASSALALVVVGGHGGALATWLVSGAGGPHIAVASSHHQAALSSIASLLP